MEAAGKVSAIEHVIKGVNPQGVLVAQVLVETVRSLDLHWLEVSEQEHAANLEARKKLESE